MIFVRLFRPQVFLYILVAIAAVWPLAVQGQDYSSRVRRGQEDRAFRTLTHSKIFNLGGFGFVLEVTPEERAFRLLLNSGNSGLFRRLMREANPEGQLFGLYGLYLEDREAFKAEVDRLKYDDGPPERWDGMIFIEKSKIRSAEGCIVFRQDRPRLMEKMARGGFDQAFQAVTNRLAQSPKSSQPLKY
jgi:hypothetical protein